MILWGKPESKIYSDLFCDLIYPNTNKSHAEGLQKFNILFLLV